MLTLDDPLTSGVTYAQTSGSLFGTVFIAPEFAGPGDRHSVLGMPHCTTPFGNYTISSGIVSSTTSVEIVYRTGAGITASNNPTMTEVFSGYQVPNTRTIVPIDICFSGGRLHVLVQDTAGQGSLIISSAPLVSKNPDFITGGFTNRVNFSTGDARDTRAPHSILAFKNKYVVVCSTDGIATYEVVAGGLVLVGSLAGAGPISHGAVQREDPGLLMLTYTGLKTVITEAFKPDANTTDTYPEVSGTVRQFLQEINRFNVNTLPVLRSTYDSVSNYYLFIEPASQLALYVRPAEGGLPTYASIWSSSVFSGATVLETRRYDVPEGVVTTLARASGGTSRTLEGFWVLETMGIALRIQQKNPLKVIVRESFNAEFTLVASNFKDQRSEYTGLEVKRIDLKASAFRKATDFVPPPNVDLALNPNVAWRIQNSRDAGQFATTPVYLTASSDLAASIQNQFFASVSSGLLLAPSVDSPIRTPSVSSRGIDDALFRLSINNADRVFFMPGSVSIQVKYAKKRRISNG
jgi:hypothetical protein